MFQYGRDPETMPRLEHRHSDGSWGRLVPRSAHHSPTEHDPESDWSKGRIYTCTSCDEEVRLMPPEREEAR
jgi:hypothetical protein